MDCFVCKGSIIDNVTNHVVTLKDTIIIIKGVPCTECVQCGEKYYDNHVAHQLEAIVNMIQATAITEIAVVNYSEQVA